MRCGCQDQTRFHTASVETGHRPEAATGQNRSSITRHRTAQRCRETVFKPSRLRLAACGRAKWQNQALQATRLNPFACIPPCHADERCVPALCPPLPAPRLPERPAEFLAADAPKHIILANRFLQGLGHAREHLVPTLVTVQIEASPVVAVSGKRSGAGSAACHSRSITRCQPARARPGTGLPPSLSPPRQKSALPDPC